MYKSFTIFTFFTLQLLSFVSSAQPANNTCATAQVIVPSSTCSNIVGTLSTAQNNGSAPSCGTAGQDVWYQFIAPSENIYIQLALNSSDLGFEIYQNTCNSSPIHCVNFVGANSVEKALFNDLNAGSTYFVRVFRPSPSGGLFFDICIQSIPEISNNICSNAQTIIPQSTCVNIPGTFSGSSMSTTSPNCASDATQDVWYQFLATSSTNLISLTASSGLNHGFEIYEGSCSGIMLHCVNNTGINAAETGIFNDFNIGTSYFIRAFNTSEILSNANFNLCVQSIPAPQNNNCSDAEILTPELSLVYTAGTFAGSSSTSLTQACNSTINQDVWYQFTATSETNSVVFQNLLSIEIGIEIFEGSCSGNILNCVFPYLTPSSSGVSDGLFNNYTVGNVYYIRVFNAQANLSISNFAICLRSYPTPGNNDCSSPQPLNINGMFCTYVSYNFAGSNSNADTPDCFSNTLQDLWYSFSPSSTTILLESGIGYEIYPVSCSGTPLYCNTQGQGTTTYLNGFIPGTTYYLRLFSTNPQLIAASFNTFFCIKSLAPPSNNSCSNAQWITPNTNNCPNITGTFSGATMALAPPSCAPNASQDVWYRFTASAETNHIYVSHYENANRGFEIYEGSCNGPVLHCVDATSSGPEFGLFNNFNIGTNYYIRIFNASSELTNTEFNICVQAIAEPMNNDCSCPINLIPNPSCMPLISTLGGSSMSSISTSCTSTASQDIWFQFVATQSNMSINISSSSYIVQGTVDFGLEIFESICFSTPLLCVNNSLGSLGESLSYNEFIEGNTYYVRVFNTLETLSAHNVSICVIGAAPYVCTPAISISSTSGTGFCLGEEVMFTANAVNGGTNPEYQWQVNGVNVGTNSGVFSSSELTSGAVVTCLLTSNALCANNSPISSNQVTMNTLNGITPTFSQVSSFCTGASIPALPTNSQNGISGTWSPAINNQQTTTYTFTPSVGSCVPVATMTIEINEIMTPSFTPVGPFCAASAIPPLPTTSLNNISGTWSPALNNQQTTTYTFTPSPGNCSSSSTMTIVINPNTTPSFTQVGPFCVGAAISPLPTTSVNNISGSWFPAINNQQTTTYTFTPSSGDCISSQTMTIVINQNTIPSFTQIGPFCPNATIAPLPTTSLNNISGTWSPALNNQETTTYTFTPNVGSCATSAAMTVEIDNNIVAAFDPVGPFCIGASIAPLPTASLNNLSGTWSPAINNQQTTTYVFTPNPGECSVIPVSMTIEINDNNTPTFTQVGPYCSGSSIPPLPTTSLNNIAGSWSPAINNQQTTTYTFTPNSGSCGVTTTMTISINLNVPSSFTQIPTYCQGAAIPPLPTTSLNNISGTWSPDINNQETTTYTFTPLSGQCGLSSTQTITILNSPVVSLTVNGANLVASGGFNSYSWTFNGNTIAGNTSSTVELSENGIYEVTVTNSSGCSGSASFNHQTASLEQITWSNSVSIYPNPSEGFTFIEIESAKQTQLNLKIYDLQGKILLDGTLHVQTGNQLFQIDLSQMSAGLYLILLSDDEDISLHRLVVQ